MRLRGRDGGAHDRLHWMHKARLNQDSKAAHKARQLFREIDLYEMSGWSIHCLTDCQIISIVTYT